MRKNAFNLLQLLIIIVIAGVIGGLIFNLAENKPSVSENSQIAEQDKLRDLKTIKNSVEQKSDIMESGINDTSEVIKIEPDSKKIYTLSVKKEKPDNKPQEVQSFCGGFTNYKNVEDSLSYKTGCLDKNSKGYFEVNGKKYSCPYSPEPISSAECEGIKNTLGIPDCMDCDYWGGAVKYCGGVEKLPTRAELKEIYEAFYHEEPEQYSTFNPQSNSYQHIYTRETSTNMGIRFVLGIAFNPVNSVSVDIERNIRADVICKMD